MINTDHHFLQGKEVLLFQLLNNNIARKTEAFLFTLVWAALNSKDAFEEVSRDVSQKLVMSIMNSLERHLNKDALIMAGLTDHEVIYRDDLLSVYHYYPLNDKEIKIGNHSIPVQKNQYRIPLVCIPPLLAPGFAFDLFPERSLVRYFLAKGFQVYLVDFGSPDKSHSHLSFEHYILEWMPASLKAIREHSGESDLSLFGYCMGGLFCLLYASIHQDQDIKNLVTVASPIDMHQMGAAGRVFSIAALPAYLLARWLHLSLRDIDPKYMHVPGKLGTLAFYLTNPLGVFKSYWDLLLNLWDRNYVAVHESLGFWINNLLDYPGATIQEIIVQMGLGNKLARKGKMKIGQKEAILKNINCSILSFAGESDEIVPINAAHKIMDVISSSEKRFYVVPGGHVGLIVGSQAPEHLWQLSTDWLSKRSA